MLEGETETAKLGDEVSEILNLLLDVLVGRVGLVGLVRPETLDALEGGLRYAVGRGKKKLEIII
jgi:hypothetical protein